MNSCVHLALVMSSLVDEAMVLFGGSICSFHSLLAHTVSCSAFTPSSSHLKKATCCQDGTIFDVLIRESSPSSM